MKFGGNRALSDVDLDVRAGEVTGLIGPNGAGKTTLFNVDHRAADARRRAAIVFDGRDVSRLDTHKRARLGIARTFQRLELFTDLSVRDNLRVAGEIRNTWSGFGGAARRRDQRRPRDRARPRPHRADRPSPTPTCRRSRPGPRASSSSAGR